VRAFRPIVAVIVVITTTGCDWAKEKAGIETYDVYDAVSRGYLQDVQAVLASGMDVNAPDKDGWTLLHLAAFKDRAMVEFLLSEGADVHARNDNGETPLHVADWSSSERFDQYQKDKYGYVRPAKSPSRCTHSCVAECLVESGAEINVFDNYGMTPLHHAANLGRVESVRLLLERGADPTTVSDDGYTALSLAEESYRMSLAFHADSPVPLDYETHLDLVKIDRELAQEIIAMLKRAIAARTKDSEEFTPTSADSAKP
jgi:ankyrin repeat protein